MAWSMAWLRWMKVVVLVAGGMGVLGFFEPFYVFVDGHDAFVEGRTTFVAQGTASVSAYQLVEDSHAQEMAAGPSDGCGAYAPGWSCVGDTKHTNDSRAPYYFLSSLVFALGGIVSIWRKRMSGVVGLATLGGSMFAIGGWIHEVNQYRIHLMHLSTGATLLGVSGLLTLLPAIAVLYWREPEPIPLFRVRLPMARVVR